MMASRAKSEKVKAHNAKMAKYFSDPEVRAELSLKISNGMKDSDRVKEHLAKARASNLSERRRKQAASLRERWKDPVYRQRMGKRMQWMRLPPQMREIVRARKRLIKAIQDRS